MTRYMHFQVVSSGKKSVPMPSITKIPELPPCVIEKLLPVPTGSSEGIVKGKGKGKAEWINCDIRTFDYSILGQYVEHLQY
jgi:mRNA (2'-O-methyladenosine-N6-)-methyltransferase